VIVGVVTAAIGVACASQPTKIKPNKNSNNRFMS
jgi:hypothetical protein